MASKNNSAYYTALPAEPTPTLPNYVVVIHNPFRHPCLYHLRPRHVTLALSLLFFCSLLYVLWPSNPEVRIVRVELNGVSVRTSPQVSLDLSLSVVARVRNRDLFSLDYDSLVVSVGYRGKELGFVRSDGGGHLKPWGSSYVDATLVVHGIEVLHDLFYFIQDVARGSVPFDTYSLVEGELGIFSLRIPIKANVSCEVSVNPKNQTIVHQNCHPE